MWSIKVTMSANGIRYISVVRSAKKPLLITSYRQARTLMAASDDLQFGGFILNRTNGEIGLLDVSVLTPGLFDANRMTMDECILHSQTRNILNFDLPGSETSGTLDFNGRIVVSATENNGELFFPYHDEITMIPGPGGGEFVHVHGAKTGYISESISPEALGERIGAGLSRYNINVKRIDLDIGGGERITAGFRQGLENSGLRSGVDVVGFEGSPKYGRMHSEAGFNPMNAEPAYKIQVGEDLYSVPLDSFMTHGFLPDVPDRHVFHYQTGNPERLSGPVSVPGMPEEYSDWCIL